MKTRSDPDDHEARTDVRRVRWISPHRASSWRSPRHIRIERVASPTPPGSTRAERGKSIRETTSAPQPARSKCRRLIHGDRPHESGCDARDVPTIGPCHGYARELGSEVIHRAVRFHVSDLTQDSPIVRRTRRGVSLAMRGMSRAVGREPGYCPWFSEEVQSRWDVEALVDLI